MGRGNWLGESSAGKFDVVVGFLSAKDVAAVSDIGLVGGDDEGYGAICAGMRKRRVICAFAGFVAAGALGVQRFATDRQRKARNQFGVGHIHADIPGSCYLRVVFAHFDGVVKRHENPPMVSVQIVDFP